MRARIDDAEGRDTLNTYASILTGDGSFFSHSGSLTTAPCTESVQWFVYSTQVKISQSDLALLRSALAALRTNELSAAGNKPLNGRSVYFSPAQV